jgi:hypothetical protein
MNAILVAVIFSVMVILDHFWEVIAKRADNPRRATKWKSYVICSLLVIGWSQAIVQCRNESQAGKDMDFLKGQLATANISLSNTTAVVNGLTLGGDSHAQIYFNATDDENELNLSLQATGGYPLRGLWVKVSDATERYKFPHDATNRPLSKVIFERHFGDYPANAWADLCKVRLDPSATNLLRFDIAALNGSSWQVTALTKTNKNWSMKLNYRWSQINGKREIEPPEMTNTIVVE